MAFNGFVFNAPPFNYIGQDHQEDRAEDAVRGVQADLHEGTQGGWNDQP